MIRRRKVDSPRGDAAQEPRSSGWSRKSMALAAVAGASAWCALCRGGGDSPKRRHSFGRGPAKQHAHVFLELRCAGGAYLHDVDGEARCTADATVALHRRAWERRVVDADLGWFLLVSTLTRRALGSSPDGSVVSLAAFDERDLRLHWRFDRLADDGAATYKRALHHRASHSRARVHDHGMKRAVLSLGSDHDVGAFVPLPVRHEAFEASVRDGAAAARRAQAEDAAAKKDLRRLFSPSGLRGGGRAEVRVISMALYGASPKYNVGAIRNAELVDAYFPGWTLRVYADGATVPQQTLDELARLNVDVRVVGAAGAWDLGAGGGLATGAIAGMFWRFLVADDAAVDRFIVRDSDSRLNARDAYAVLDWIDSGRATHTLRDHPNHARQLNGGMWGATRRSAVHGKMQELAAAFSNHDVYGADLDFLQQAVYPIIQGDVVAHDAYTCESFKGSRPFPTRRPEDYQHVGQVFDAEDRPRMDDVESFTRGLQTPKSCRKKPEWIYG